MKKATNKARKPSKAKAPKGMRQVNPILDMLKNMDQDLVAMLRQTVQKETGWVDRAFESSGRREFSGHMAVLSCRTINEMEI